MRRLDDTSLMYASAAVKVREAKDRDAAVIERIVSAPDYAGALKAFGELECAASCGADFEAAINGATAELFAFLDEALGGEATEITDYLRAEYLCLDIKSMLKSAVFGREFPENAFFPAGGLTLPELLRIGENAQYSLLPVPFADYAAKAAETAAKTHDPSEIDALTDRACFEYVAEKAAASGVELLGILTALKADFTNITCRIREKATGRRNRGGAFAGGTLDEESLDVIAEGGEKAVSLLKAHGFETLASLFSASLPDAAALRRECDRLYIRQLDRYFFVPFGPDTIVAYGEKKKNSLRMLRIAMTCKKVGLAESEIRRRIII